MKRIVLVCCILLAAVLVIAGQSDLLNTGKDGADQPTVQSAGVGTAVSVGPAAYEALKDRYYVLVDRVNNDTATEFEITELREMCFSWDLQLPEVLIPQEPELPQRDVNPLDQGGVDTLSNCAGAAVIPSCPYSDTGNFDGDNDCSVGAAAPYNEVFYSFIPTTTGYYQFRARNTVGTASGHNAAIRVVSGGCCTGSVLVYASSSSVAGECGEVVNQATYARATLTAGTQYWIHVGTAGSTYITSGAYEFSMTCVPCPAPELDGPTHNTCATAQVIACNDSIFGDSAIAATPDWYRIELAEAESLRVFVGGRELGHCNSGLYPGSTSIDGRFTIYRSCALTCSDSVGYDNDTGCSFDAKKAFCLAAGTYYIKVWNTTVAEYVMKVDCGPPCTPAPVLVPTNDLCANAVPVAIPSATNGTTVCATTDVVLTCGSGYTAGSPSVWYTVIGNGNTLTADMCNASYDSRLAVYTGTCGTFTCVGGDDDACDTPNGLASRVIWCSDAGVVYFLYVNAYSSTGSGTFTLTITNGQNCHIDCANYPPCGSPAEVEPNDACANSANFLSLACGADGQPAFYYGTICPQTDVDYYHVPGVGLGQIVRIKLYEGENCDVYPPIGLRMRGATAADGSCAAATGTITTNYVLGTVCSPFTGGYVGVVRNAGFENKYKIEVSCSTAVLPACPNEVVANQHCAGPCVGPIPDVTTVSYPLDVPIEYHITDVNVRVNITHTYDADIDMYLVTPWSDTLELSTDNGVGGDNFQVTVFDDEGVNGPVTAGVAPFNGSYIPEELLAGADGFNAVGTWRLVIIDDVGGDIGYVNCWCLEFNYDYILAAQLNSFDVIGRDGEVEVTWTTASETNNDRFEITRNGTMVAEVDATNNAAGSSYSWTDHGLTNGTTYTYSLVAVDMNGGRSELATESVVPSAGAAVITEYALHQNYPNPFNPTTTITFDLVEAGNVTLTVYNLMGQEIATLVNNELAAGRHQVAFDAANLPSGLYLYRMEANGFTDQHKMLLMK